ncbi:MAG TPA: magnesium transporter CorA family protein [Acidobacteriaceae bacterium]|nr:magnesium transporter CorA family protein [Acidobacteriaceae bacterium]
MPWYVIDNPNDPRLDELAVQFQLHPLHIEDCRSNNERLKAEGTDHYLFLILKYIQSVEDGDLGFGSIYLFVGRDFLISVRDPSCVSNEILLRAQKAGQDEAPSKLLYLIVDSIVDSYFVSIDHSDDRIDDLQDSVLDNPSPEILQDLFDQKRKLIELRRILVNLRDACMSLQRESGTVLQPELYPFFRDVYDHALRLLDMVETLRDLLNNTFDVYLSSVANRTNQVMKVLTVLSTIALPALVLSGIYGMNLKGLPFLESDHGTEIVVGAMILSTALVLWMLKRFDWL